MRHALAAIEAAIFFGRPIALPAPCLKIRLSPSRQERAPYDLESGSRLVERSRGAALMFAGAGYTIKNPQLQPHGSVGRIARAPRAAGNQEPAGELWPGKLGACRNVGAAAKP
jgi:hypothetical protein